MSDASHRHGRGSLEWTVSLMLRMVASTALLCSTSLVAVNTGIELRTFTGQNCTL